MVGLPSRESITFTALSVDCLAPARADNAAIVGVSLGLLTQRHSTTYHFFKRGANRSKYRG